MGIRNWQAVARGRKEWGRIVFEAKRSVALDDDEEEEEEEEEEKIIIIIIIIIIIFCTPIVYPVVCSHLLIIIIIQSLTLQFRSLFKMKLLLLLL